jgi:MFS family permease
VSDHFRLQYPPVPPPADSSVIYSFGRRTLYTVGMGTMAVVLIIIGGLGFMSSTSANYAIGSLLIALNFIYNATLGPLCYTIIGEMSSTRLRQKSIVLSRIAYQIMNIICGIIVSHRTENSRPKPGKAVQKWAMVCGLGGIVSGGSPTEERTLQSLS